MAGWAVTFCPLARRGSVCPCGRDGEITGRRRQDRDEGGGMVGIDGGIGNAGSGEIRRVVILK